MFDLGWGELVVIGIVALIAIGPKELPTVLRTIGQMMGKVRRMANEFQGQFQEALREADIADLKKQADEVTSSLNSTVTDFTQYDPMAETQKDIEQSLNALDKPAESAAETPAQTAADAAPAELPPPAEQAAVAPASGADNDLAAAEPPPGKQAGGNA